MKKIIQLDGWKVAVDWHRLYYGDSFFIPSVNWKHDKAALKASAEEVGCGVEIKGVVEDDVMGLRVWCLTQVI